MCGILLELLRTQHVGANTISLFVVIVHERTNVDCSCCCVCEYYYCCAARKGRDRVLLYMNVLYSYATCGESCCSARFAYTAVTAVCMCTTMLRGHVAVGRRRSLQGFHVPPSLRVPIAVNWVGHCTQQVEVEKLHTAAAVFPHQNKRTYKPVCGVWLLNQSVYLNINI